MISKARSHEIGSNSPAPRGEPALRRRGLVSRAGEYCFMMPAEPYTYVSSRLVKEVVALGGDIADFVPKAVLQRFQQDEQGQ